MSDVSALRVRLSRVDGSAPAIQSAAGAMMRHYDSTSRIAVTEWRNALQTARKEQLLPLLYVANEVLQTSKRNRGPKFLQAFGDCLSQALQHVCMSDRTLTEKVRRTVKIWGDRHVFSTRYVGSILAKLEPYRGSAPIVNNASVVNNNNNTTRKSPPPPAPKVQQEEEPARFSPSTTSSNEATAATTVSHESSSASKTKQNAASADDDDIMDIVNDTTKNNKKEKRASSHSDDDDDVFESQSEGLKLEINLESSLLDSAAAASSTGSNSKRRRSSAASTNSAGSQGSSSRRQKRQRKRRLSALSTSNFLDLWNRISGRQQTFNHSALQLEKMEMYLEKHSAESLAEEVGDELQNQYKRVVDLLSQLDKHERRTLHTTATETRGLEQEACRYVPWLERAIQQDEEDAAFCKVLEGQLERFGYVHDVVREARDQVRRETEAKHRQQALRERQRAEAAEAERFRRAALAKETEAKPGMVWNPTTREYQALNTDESWRD